MQGENDGGGQRSVGNSAPERAQLAISSGASTVSFDTKLEINLSFSAEVSLRCQSNGRPET
jgi:hypothetical protein